VACQILFAFASFAESVLRLLNCVEVNGKDVLYYAGAVDCNVGGFRGFFVLLLLVLLLVPLSAVCWPMVPMLTKKNTPQIFPEALQQHPVIQAFRRHATEPFKGECENWAAVLILQRLATVMCQSLSTAEAAGSIAITSVSFFSTLLQLHARPYRLSRDNTLQLLALVCLTMISVLNSAQSAFESAGVDAEQSPALAELVGDAELIMFLLLLPPPLLLLYHTVSAVSRGGDGTELVVVEDDKLNERRRHEEERVQLLAENDRALVAKDAEKEQQLATKEQQLTGERQRHKEEMKQQLAAKDAEIEHLLAEMASSGSKKSSEGAGAAGTGATKKGRHQYSTVEQPIQR
jgi:hypothetical protein